MLITVILYLLGAVTLALVFAPFVMRNNHAEQTGEDGL